MANAKTKGVPLSSEGDFLALALRRPTEASDEVDIQLDGPPGSITFNARFLSEILVQTGGDTVRLKLGNEVSPAVIGDRLGEGLFVLMPLRPGYADA